ncbi:GNAT family N-acetyltransferase [Algivirga pacifica]|uniref:N-acetyltransferase domain-containing protein n=1 Tax=Algivirga pacifica TaxID=1162670 RepID=A0ABP9D9A4_9BACT
MIRPYHPDDYPKVIALMQANTPAYFAEEEITDLEDYLKQHIEDYFLFEEEGEILGAAGINYFPEQQEARLSWDFVHPDAHGKGIGKQLTLFRLKHIQSQKLYSNIIVRTSQLAYQFYEKMGFTLLFVKENGWAEGYHLYHMQLRSY